MFWYEWMAIIISLIHEEQSFVVKIIELKIYSLKE
jgi:hypothetical protein